MWSSWYLFLLFPKNLTNCRALCVWNILFSLEIPRKQISRTHKVGKSAFFSRTQVLEKWVLEKTSSLDHQSFHLAWSLECRQWHELYAAYASFFYYYHGQSCAWMPNQIWSTSTMCKRVNLIFSNTLQQSNSTKMNRRCWARIRCFYAHFFFHYHCQSCERIQNQQWTISVVCKKVINDIFHHGLELWGHVDTNSMQRNSWWPFRYTKLLFSFHFFFPSWCCRSLLRFSFFCCCSFLIPSLCLHQQRWCMQLNRIVEEKPNCGSITQPLSSTKMKVHSMETNDCFLFYVSWWHR